jgi:hypothetical protein
VADHHGYSDPVAVGHAWVARRPSPSGASNALLLDRYGDVVVAGPGDYLIGDDMVEELLSTMIARYTRRHLGGEGKPTVWLVEHTRIVSLTPSAAVDAVRASGPRPAPQRVTAIVVTSR